jgi:phytoene dehydrogenase-like protein
MTTCVDVAIVGGGIAGLTAANYLAKAGKKVALFERSSQWGGRAGSQSHHGMIFNQGAHALYAGAEGIEVLRELQVPFLGTLVEAKGGLEIDGSLVPLPSGPSSLLTMGGLGLGSKVSLASALAKIMMKNANNFNHITLEDWLRQEIADSKARSVVAALFRLSTYLDVPKHSSAGVAIRQMQRAFKKGVFYLDGGWQSMVDLLLHQATTLGALCEQNQRVYRIEKAEQGWLVRTRETELCTAKHVVLAVPPRVAAGLVGEVEDPWVQTWRSKVPVTAACLEIALNHLPNPEMPFAISADRPLYFSVHSNWAKLAPAGIHVIHTIYYGGNQDTVNGESILESFIEQVQPGFREFQVHRRYLPQMTVVGDLAPASEGGLLGRTACHDPQWPGLWLAGDWVGSQGFLADASFASAREVARGIMLEGQVLAA